MLRRIFRGLFTGGLVGFVLGLLIAPKKGEQTREELKKFADANAPKLNNYLETAKKTVLAWKDKIFTCCSKD